MIPYCVCAYVCVCVCSDTGKIGDGLLLDVNIINEEMFSYRLMYRVTC